ncbi:MAG: RNA polymerase sigma factor [Cyclobacteriaceae bacterium]|nr:RNA polymerase sigma factor [Cyclobacteriaceae bacterium]
MEALEFGSTLNNLTISLRPIALQLTRDYEDTNDLLQETLLKAFRNRHRFNEGTNLKAWVYTIMKNTFLSNYQKKIRRKTYVDTTDNQYFINTVAAGFSRESADTSVNMEEIQSAINNLSPQYRIPFEMHFTGYKYEEIAQQLEIPLGTVKNRIFIARQELKEKLKNFA